MHHFLDCPCFIGMPVRFAENDNSAYHGIVEVRYKGVWSRICQQGWDDADATVFCRQLGYKVCSDLFKFEKAQCH